MHLCSVPLLCGLGLVQSPTVVTSVSFFGSTSRLCYWGLSLGLISRWYRLGVKLRSLISVVGGIYFPHNGTSTPIRGLAIYFELW